MAQRLATWKCNFLTGMNDLCDVRVSFIATRMPFRFFFFFFFFFLFFFFCFSLRWSSCLFFGRLTHEITNVATWWVFSWNNCVFGYRDHYVLQLVERSMNFHVMCMLLSFFALYLMHFFCRSSQLYFTIFFSYFIHMWKNIGVTA